MRSSFQVVCVAAIVAALGSAAMADGSRQTKLTANDGEAIDLFGESISLSGKSAVIGAVWRLSDAEKLIGNLIPRVRAWVVRG
jgi:hypothetical protein